MSRDIVIVAGAIGRANVGGKAWVYLQYLIGLRQLGFDVYYLEDAGDESWVYDWESEAFVTGADYPARFVRECLTPYGLDGRFAYRSGDESVGLPASELRELCARARALIIHGDPFDVWRPEYGEAHRRVFVDLDPGFTQLRLLKGDKSLTHTASRCDILFTIGWGIGSSSCGVPRDGREWLPTRPPVCLGDWPVADSCEPDAPFTSVMDWRGFRDVEYAGESYGQKDREFPAFLDLPSRTSQPLLLAIGGTALERVTAHGWRAVSGWQVSRTPGCYERFIRRSRGEFGVAKHGYVKTRAGWFSDRSVCYLASGKPVLVQDTGQGEHLPVGDGIVTFTDVKSAARGLEKINARYDEHARAARQIAEDVFDAGRVLPQMMQRVI
jgi:hypothetical protein